MPLNLQEFISNVSSDTLKKSRFEVKFLSFPSVTSDFLNLDPTEEPVFRGGTFDVKNLTFRCESCSLPGMQLLTKDYKLYSGMPNLKIPNGREHDDIDFTFISSSEMREKKAIEAWIYTINNFSNNNLAYYDDIKADIQIDVYSDEFKSATADYKITYEPPYQDERFRGTLTEIIPGTPSGPKKVYSIKLIGAYPLRLESLPVSWNDTDELIKFTTTFTYEQLEFIAEGFSHNEKTFDRTNQPSDIPAQ
jgi:hypothetical protein